MGKFIAWISAGVDMETARQMRPVPRSSSAAWILGPTHPPAE